jgi:hypothetical protein
MIQIVCPVEIFWETAAIILRHPAMKDRRKKKIREKMQMSKARPL